MKILIKDIFDVELKEKWEKLEKESKITIFQKYQWNYHWYKYISNNIGPVKIKIFLIYKNNNLVAILPFYIKKNSIYKSLEWLGGLHSDYKGPIFKDSTQLTKDEFFDILKQIIKDIKGVDLLSFEQQLTDQKIHNNPFAYFLPSTHKESTLGIRITEKWENFYEKKSSKTRQTIRRKIKKLEENGKLEFCVAEDINQKKKILNWTIVEKQKQFFDTGALDIFKEKNEKEFYISLLEKHNYFHCTCIYQNQKIIASHIGINDNGNFLYLIPCYIKDEKMKTFSPGQILQVFLLKWCFENNINYFDYALGGEEYKKDWNNSTQNLTNHYKPITSIGLIIYYKIVIKKFIKNIFKNEK